MIQLIIPRVTINTIASVIGAIFLVAFAAAALFRPSLEWPDRRPIGALFVADHGHASATNPRGWFNRSELDVAGAGGIERFREALLQYADRSIAILRQTGAQGMIVWDLEGEEFPQKTTYIGDPRLLNPLAPEMAAVVDEFFYRFRVAGLRVGMTIRPQQLVFDSTGHPTQRDVSDYDRVLLEKIDYARKRWDATLFYVDSNGGVRWPAEALRLRHVARQCPDVLLIPEHHDLLYYAFSAPYTSIWKDHSPPSGLLRLMYPNSFKVLNVADAGRRQRDIAAAYRDGNILLFPAWLCGPECRLLETLRGTQVTH